MEAPLLSNPARLPECPKAGKLSKLLLQHINGTYGAMITGHLEVDTTYVQVRDFDVDDGDLDHVWIETAKALVQVSTGCNCHLCLVCSSLWYAGIARSECTWLCSSSSNSSSVEHSTSMPTVPWTVAQPASPPSCFLAICQTHMIVACCALCTAMSPAGAAALQLQHLHILFGGCCAQGHAGGSSKCRACSAV